MGYYSNVTLAVAFEHKEEMEEVLAVYRMDPAVQKYNIMDKWKVCPDHDPPYMVCAMDSVKWAEFYEDVQAIYYIESLCDQFKDKRGFQYAEYFVRIGEGPADIEDNDFATDGGHDLQQFLWDAIRIVSTIECDL